MTLGSRLHVASCTAAPAMVLLFTAARLSTAQSTAPPGAACTETRSVLSAPVVNVTNVQLSMTRQARRVVASTATRLEALAAARQCVESDLRDPALHLRRQAMLTRDVPDGRLHEPPTDSSRAGVWLRGRFNARIDPTGDRAGEYDMALGVWRAFGSVTLTTYVRDVETPVSRARVVRGAPSVDPPCDTGCIVSPSSSPTTVDSSAKLANGRAREFVMSATTWWRGVDWDLSAGTSLASADGPRRWAIGQAAVPIGARLDVVMLARLSSRQVNPSRHEIGAMLRYHLGRVSVSSRPSPVGESAAFRAERTEHEDIYRLVIHAGHSTSVSIRADFTDWRSVSLGRLGNGDWAVTLRVPEGIHHVLMQLDGEEWVVPSGLPVAPDGFGQLVGILRIGDG